MIPGMNSRQARQMMRKMGIDEQEIDAMQVIIKTKEGDLVFDGPSVSKISMSGQETYQIVGTPELIQPDVSITIDETDIQTVTEQTGVSEDKARQALEENNGDIAATILSLTDEQ